MINKQSILAFVLIAGAFHLFAFSSEPTSNPSRDVIPLNGDWLFQRDGDQTEPWKTIQLPASFQDHEGTQFHGVGWYRKNIAAFPLPAGKRVLLHFQAAATEAEVWWNGVKLGRHLGGWTPFRFDVTEQVRNVPAGQPHELRIRLDEKVGHNTQGFLPFIAPHFGGLWQPATITLG